LNGKSVLRVLAAFACVLFIGSILYPFLQVQLFGIETFTGSPGPETFWSFKVTTVYFRTPDNPGVPIMREYWFADYWTEYINYKTLELGLGIGYILVFMFGIQVLTILFAILAISRVKPYQFLSATIPNVLITFCMWLTSRAFIHPYYWVEFQTGFWLTFASVTLFLAASILSWRWLKQEATR
jgi:hypothetical protein